MPTDMPAAPLTAAAKGSWTGLLATAGLVFLGVILLGGAVVPWWLSEPSRVTAWVSHNVPNLHGRVEMAKATFTWLGPIAFEDVVVVPANGAREPVVIQRIEASHGIAAFIFTGGDVGHVTVTGLETHLVFDEDRNSNAAGLFVDPSDPDEGHRPPRKTPLRMVLDVVDARVRIEGPWSPDPWISDPIDVTLRLAHTPAGDASEWSLEPTTILEGALLEPSVAQGVLAYIAPVLADATRPAGRFSLALDGGTFPVGAPEKSMFSGKLTMHAVDLGPGPMVAGLLAALPGRIQVPTSMTTPRSPSGWKTGGCGTRGSSSAFRCRVAGAVSISRRGGRWGSTTRFSTSSSPSPSRPTFPPTARSLPRWPGRRCRLGSVASSASRGSISTARSAGRLPA